MGNFGILNFFDHQLRSQLVDPSGTVLRPEHKASFAMITFAESDIRHPLPMLITVTHQSKEQEQGREDQGCECVGHHRGRPLLRLTEQVLPKEDLRTGTSSRAAMYPKRSVTTMKRKGPQRLTLGNKRPVGLSPLLNIGF